MKTHEAYCMAVDILSNTVDWKKVCLQIAKDSPSLFVRSFEKVNMSCKDKNDDFLIELIRSGQFISAVKERRNQAGEGLKDAKDYCDALCEKFNLK